jgi:hypothetical protein
MDERKLIELANIFMSVSDSITISVDCVDGKSMSFNSVDELVAYPNRKKSQFETIELSNGYDSKTNLSVTFGNREYRSISYRITAEEDKVDYYSVKIEDFILSLKQWYSFLNYHTSFFLVTVTLALSVGYLLNSFFNLNDQANMLLIIILGFLISRLYDLIKNLIFPVALFKLGDGIERVEKKLRNQNFFIFGILFTGAFSYMINQIPNIFK